MSGPQYGNEHFLWPNCKLGCTHSARRAFSNCSSLYRLVLHHFHSHLGKRTNSKIDTVLTNQQVIVELIVQFVARNKPCTITGRTDECPSLSNAVVLIVGGIPVAMPTV